VNAQTYNKFHLIKAQRHQIMLKQYEANGLAKEKSLEIS